LLEAGEKWPIRRLTPIGTSIYVFGSDLLDEGVEEVLERIQHRAGVDGVMLAPVYHVAQDVFPTI
jgi:hypothetical protein